MRILYIMNIEWHWIKQRPHYIAEGLTENNTVFLYYPYSYHRQGRGYVENATDRFRPRRYFNIPLYQRSKLLTRLNELYLKMLFSILILIHRPDVIWIARPQDIAYIPHRINARLVYDCMDDHFSMQEDPSILTYEKQLVQRCDAVFASSMSLIEKLKSRYNMSENVHLVRNGYNPSLEKLPSYNADPERFNLYYIGTVSSWFDFDLIGKILEHFDNVTVNIIGPVEACIVDIAEKLKKNSRVRFFGSVEHTRLTENIKDCDCFMLPFVPNDIIRSVDPVKLYEYISFGRNILSLRYDEIERFDQFVYFYNTHDEALSQLEAMMSEHRVKYTEDESSDFLKDNTWNQRVLTIEETLSELG